MTHEQIPWTGKRQEDILKDISEDVIEYIRWYAENGYYLPENYSHDPSSWTEILRKIERAFELLFVDKPTPVQKFEKENGLMLFYKNMESLWR